jgi:hypothetical protein
LKTFTSNDAAARPVNPMSGTCCTNVPSGLPGARPRRVNWPTRHATVRSSPAVPGARPSLSSAASAFTWSSIDDDVMARAAAAT